VVPASKFGKRNKRRFWVDSGKHLFVQGRQPLQCVAAAAADDDDDDDNGDSPSMLTCILSG
jgi:hypothetical protein